MKNLIISVIVLCGLLSWGCETDYPGDMNPEPNDQEEFMFKSGEMDEFSPSTGNITGQVFFAGSEIPVPGATVTISDESANSCEEGRFCLTNIPLGIHELVACKDEFEACSDEVEVGENPKEVIVYMTSREHTSKVFGTITGDYTGNPMSHLHVKILNPDGSESKLAAVTEYDGSFQLPPVPHGVRELVVKCCDDVVFKGEITPESQELGIDVEVSEAFDFFDKRDGRKYKAIRIGNQTWMAENLNYRQYPESSFQNSVEGLAETPFSLDEMDGIENEAAVPNRDHRKYGSLYNWEEAIEACPEGWHLPTDEEWKILEKNLGMSAIEADGRGRRENSAEGTKVKSADDWYKDGNGDNHSGFNVLPAGMSTGFGKDIRVGALAYFWTSTQAGESKAWYRELSYSKNGINRLYYRKNAGFSVRCIKNVDRIKEPGVGGPS